MKIGCCAFAVLQEGPEEYRRIFNLEDELSE